MYVAHGMRACERDRDRGMNYEKGGNQLDNVMAVDPLVKRAQCGQSALHHYQKGHNRWWSSALPPSIQTSPIYIYICQI